MKYKEIQLLVRACGGYNGFNGEWWHGALCLEDLNSTHQLLLRAWICLLKKSSIKATLHESGEAILKRVPNLGAEAQVVAGS